MKDRLKVAVIGAGMFGAVHIRSYAQYPRADLVKVCDASRERAEKVEKEYGVDTCADYREIVEDDSIEAVSVVTPDFLHRDIAVELLEAGKHVLIEKPLATSTADARDMVEAAQRSKRHLMVDFQNRFNPPCVEAKRRIERGEFGQPVTGWARLANVLRVPRDMLSWSGRSGPQWFLMPHTVDLVCWFYGRQVEKVVAFGRKGVLREMGIDAYDAVQALLFFGDCSAVVETAWIMPESRPSVSDFRTFLQGTKSTMRLTPLYPLLEVMGEKVEWLSTTSFYETHGVQQGWMIAPLMHFVDRLLKGEQPMCDAREGFHNTAVIEAVVRSVESGGLEEVERL